MMDNRVVWVPGDPAQCLYKNRGQNFRKIVPGRQQVIFSCGIVSSLQKTKCRLDTILQSI